MAGFSDLFETLMSSSVEIAGQGALHGGKGMLLASARKIGWASGSSGRQGRRFAGHSISRKSLGSGFGGASRGPLGTYDPRAQYNQAMKCGSGVMQFGAPQRRGPAKLHGRPCFDAPSSPLGRSSNQWVKNSATKPGSYTRTPRSNIKY